MVVCNNKIQQLFQFFVYFFLLFKDHIYHDTAILGGMWGIHNSVNRSLSNKIYSLLMNKQLCRRFNKNQQSPKQKDQQFLAQNVYGMIVSRSLVHDSYFCKKYSNAKPFPTQRIVMDHVGSVKSEKNATKNIKECPKDCRPPDHQDWKFC